MSRIEAFQQFQLEMVKLNKAIENEDLREQVVSLNKAITALELAETLTVEMVSPTAFN